MTGYHIATFDPRIADQWHLSAPRDVAGDEIRGYHFTLGRPYSGPQPATIPIYREGRSLEVSFGAEKIVVASNRAKAALEVIAAQDCQFFEVAIPRMTQPWHILNAIHLVDCFDESKSRFSPGPADGERYALVTRLVIDPTRVRGQQLFRVQRWDVDLIVSDAVKAVIEQIPNHGVRFIQVTP